MRPTLVRIGTMRPSLGLVPRIRIILGIRIRILVLAVSRDYLNTIVPYLLFERCGQINNSDQLDYPASANKIQDAVECRVRSFEMQSRFLLMSKTHKNLFETIISRENFADALVKTRRGKRNSSSYLEFKEYGELNLELLRQEVADNGYSRADFREFYIRDPKVRLISALPFRDRIVQHALNNIIEPIYLPRFLPYTFACLPSRGTHAGVKYIQSILRKCKATHFLKTDFSKFFPSIDTDILYQIHDKKIGCHKSINLMERIQPRGEQGIAIGSLKSQLNANLMGTLADNFIHHELRPMAWARYMDDIVILDNDPGKLMDMKNRLEDFALSKMRMRYSKWSVAPLSRGINFLGYRIWPNYKLLRKLSVMRAKRVIKSLRSKGDIEALNRFIASWVGHAKWADTRNLLNYLEVSK